VYLRRPEAVEAELRPVADALGLHLVIATWREASAMVDDDVVVSTVPRGAADEYAGIAWRAGGVLFDVVYDPWPTPVAQAARRAGASVISGLDLLLAQGVRQFELFTGAPAPVEPMRAALFAAAGTV
jgi:shikimate dehydrogenase